MTEVPEVYYPNFCLLTKQEMSINLERGFMSHDCKQTKYSKIKSFYRFR